MKDKSKKKLNKFEKEKLNKELKTNNRMLTLTIVISVLFVITIILYESFGTKTTSSIDKQYKHLKTKILVNDNYVEREINYIGFSDIPETSDKVFAIDKDELALFSYDYQQFSSKELDKDNFYLLGYYECNNHEICEVVELSNYHNEACILDGNNILRYNYLDNTSKIIDINSNDFGYLKYFEDSDKIYGYLYNNTVDYTSYFYDISKEAVTKTFDSSNLYELESLDLKNNLIYLVSSYDYNDNELGYRIAPKNELIVYNFSTWEVIKKLDSNYNLSKITLGSTTYYVGYSNIEYYYNDNGSYNTYIYNSKFERVNEIPFYHYIINSDNTISFLDFSENIKSDSNTKELINYNYTYSTYDSNFKLINEISSINNKLFIPKLLEDYLIVSELDSVNKDNTTNKVILIKTNGDVKKNILTLKENDILNDIERLLINNKDCILITLDRELESEILEYYYYIEQD